MKDVPTVPKWSMYANRSYNARQGTAYTYGPKTKIDMQVGKAVNNGHTNAGGDVCVGKGQQPKKAL